MLTSRLCGGTEVMFLPCNRIEPALGSLKPAIIRSVVVLPQPDGPSSEKNSFSAISRLRSLTTVELPNTLHRPTRLIAVAVAVIGRLLW